MLCRHRRGSNHTLQGSTTRLLLRLPQETEHQPTQVLINLCWMLNYIHNSTQYSSLAALMNNKIALACLVHKTWASSPLRKWGAACPSFHQEYRSYKTFRRIISLPTSSKLYTRHSLRTNSTLNIFRNSSKMRRHRQWLSRVTRPNLPSNSYP